jgi:hypothetical protein
MSRSRGLCSQNAAARCINSLRAHALGGGTTCVANGSALTHMACPLWQGPNALITRRVAALIFDARYGAFSSPGAVRAARVHFRWGYSMIVGAPSNDGCKCVHSRLTVPYVDGIGGPLVANAAAAAAAAAASVALLLLLCSRMMHPAQPTCPCHRHNLTMVDFLEGMIRVAYAILHQRDSQVP